MTEEKTYKCPACHGEGGKTIPILDYGEGPFEECGFCNGKGELPRKEFYKVLGYLGGWASASYRNAKKFQEN